MIKRLLKNAYSLNLVVKVASLGMAIVSGALFTRFMGPALKGQFASLESVGLVISVLLNFGIYHLYPKMIKDKVENVRQKFLNIFFFLQLVYMSVVGIAFVYTQNVDVLYLGSISIVGCLVSQLTMVCMVEYPIYRSISLLVVSIANLVTTIIIYIVDAAHILLVPVLVYLLKDVLFCLLIMVKIRVLPNPFNIDFKLLMHLIKIGFVPMVTALLLKLNYKVDIIMLNLFKIHDEAIGIYSVAISVASQLWILPEAFKEVLYSKSTENNPERAFVSALKISTYSLFLFDLFIIAVGYWIVLFLFGLPFIGAYQHLIVLIIGVPFMGVFNILNPYYLAMGLYTVHMKNLAFGVVSNIIVNSLLIIPLGAFGAAIATSVSQIVCGIYACFQFSKNSSISLKEIMLVNKSDVNLIKRIIKRN